MRVWKRGCFRLLFTLQPPKTRMETRVFGTFFRHRFQRPAFSPVHSVSNGAFSEKALLSNRFPKASFHQRFWSF